MLLRLLRLAHRRPLAALALVATLLTLAVALVAAGRIGSGAAPLEEDAAKNPRLILGRAWFDRMPEKRTDAVDLWIFFGGGIGIHENGSRYRATFEIFEIERQGSKLEIQYLHEKKKLTTSFTVEPCHDKPHFNLCLTLKDMPGGPLKLYGFEYDDDMDAAIPWGRSRLEAAKALASSPRE